MKTPSLHFMRRISKHGDGKHERYNLRFTVTGGEFTDEMEEQSGAYLDYVNRNRPPKIENP